MLYDPIINLTAYKSHFNMYAKTELLYFVFGSGVDIKTFVKH